NDGQRVEVRAARRREKTSLCDPIGASLEVRLRDQAELLGEQILGLAVLVGADQEDVVRGEEFVELLFRLSQLVPRLVELVRQELRGVARPFDLLVELLGDERVGYGVRDPRGQVGMMTVEGDLHEPGVPHWLDGEMLLKRLR